MRRLTTGITCLLGMAGLACLSTRFAAAKSATPVIDDRLIEAIRWSGETSNGVTVSDDGRIFVNFPRLMGTPHMSIAEWKDGSFHPYPSADWNDSEQAKQEPESRFVRTNSLRIGPEGDLWVVDMGTVKDGEPVLPGGPKIVQIDLPANRVRRVYPLMEAVKTKSFVDDMRLNGDYAYITDAGEPALIVLDLRSGTARRVLENHPSTVAKQMTGEGKKMYDLKGKPVKIHADQLEVSPDGAYLYYQPCNGGMSRIATRLLDDPAVPAQELARHVEYWLDTPPTGGTAMDADGNLYYSDTNVRRVLKYAPDKTMSVLTADDRLVWPDALWIDRNGDLWIPAAQMNRDAAYNKGKSHQEQPFQIFRLPLAAKPLRH